MNTQTLTMIIGFLGIIFTVISVNNQTRTEMNNRIDKLETKFEKEISRLEKEMAKLDSDIKALNTKLDSFLMAVFSKTISQTSSKDDKDVA